MAEHLRYYYYNPSCKVVALICHPPNFRRMLRDHKNLTLESIGFHLLIRDFLSHFVHPSIPLSCWCLFGLSCTPPHFFSHCLLGSYELQLPSLISSPLDSCWSHSLSFVFHSRSLWIDALIWSSCYTLQLTLLPSTVCVRLTPSNLYREISPYSSI